MPHSRREENEDLQPSMGSKVIKSPTIAEDAGSGVTTPMKPWMSQASSMGVAAGKSGTVGQIGGKMKSAFRKVSAKYYEDGEFKEVSGYFHQWGLSFDQDLDQSYAWNYTVAIIESFDGKIIIALPENVIFLDE